MTILWSPLPQFSCNLYRYFRELASGSGDATVRFWDLNTETPLHTARGHTNWVLCIAWSPDGKKLASACKNGHVRLSEIYFNKLYVLATEIHC